MPRWASTIEIAGVVYSGCRGELQDGHEFASIYKGSVELAADGTPHTQVVNTGVKGIGFGITMLSVETSKLVTMRTAIQTAQGQLVPFAVNIVDELYAVDLLVVPDYNQRWFQHGQTAQGYTPNVALRFISVALNT